MCRDLQAMPKRSAPGLKGSRFAGGWDEIQKIEPKLAHRS
jgi:hypothetical protein